MSQNYQGDAGYARAIDGGLVPVGQPVSNTTAARLWRLPTQFLPTALAVAAPLVSAAVWALVAFATYRLVSQKIK
jgi:hypothetical protein